MTTTPSPANRTASADQRREERKVAGVCIECERERRRRQKEKTAKNPEPVPTRPPRAKPARRQQRENVRALRSAKAKTKTPSTKTRQQRQTERATARKTSARCAACEKAEREQKAQEAAKAREARRQPAAKNGSQNTTPASSTSRDAVMIMPKPTPGEPKPPAAAQAPQTVPAKREQGNRGDAAARKDPLPAFRFRVQIDGLAPMAFKECRGLENATETFQIKEGGMNSYRFSSAGHTRHGDIVLRKGVGADADLWKWRKEIQTSPGQARRNGTISLMERGEVKKSWNFYNAWPCRYEGPALDALAEETAMVTIHLAAERIEEA